MHETINHQKYPFEIQRPTVKTLGGLVVAAGSVELGAWTNLEDHNHVEIPPMDKRNAGHVLQAMKNTAAAMAHVDQLDFTFSDRKLDGGRLLRYKARWGEVDKKSLEGAGLSVEIAGPTKRRKGHNMLPRFKPQVVTNVSTMHRTARGEDGRPIKGRLDALTDAAHMPFRDASVGSVHISCLPGSRVGRQLQHDRSLRHEAIQESARVLKEGGYLVWDGGVPEDYESIVQNGLSPVALVFDLKLYEADVDHYDSPQLDVDGIYQKISPPPEPKP